MRFSLKEYNTFGLNALCDKVVRIKSIDRLVETIQKDANEKLIIGSGSNILFTKDVEGTVLINQLIGKRIIEQNDDFAIVEFASGEIWDECVEWAIENEFGGLENLTMIPGTAGAAPIQNIGAYGVELSDVFVSLEAYDLIWGEIKIFNKEECKFGYRDSVFKNELKNQYFITKITLKLTVGEHKINIDYGDIKKVLEENGVEEPDISDISDAVFEIRESKLPDPYELANAGSFFKNPIIDAKELDRLKGEFPDLRFFKTDDKSKFKLVAGWLIEQSGWKGKTVGDAGVHDQHALIIVNHGKATGGEILSLSRKVQKSVKEKFGIQLIPEVNIL